MTLEGKVALVIGASRGMGKRMALELARQGADIAIAARTDRPGQSETSGTIHQTAEEIRALGRQALPVRVDLADSGQIDEMHRAVVDHYGGYDLLIHSVQYMGPGYLSTFLDTSVAQLARLQHRKYNLYVLEGSGQGRGERLAKGSQCILRAATHHTAARARGQ